MENKWIRIRKRYRNIELCGIIVIVVLSIIGIIFDWNIGQGIIYHEVNDLQSFSLTLLQIQASVSTLTIALIALISGNISESYMGVSICNYYLNIRPVLLNQKRIIFSSLGLLFLNAILHLWECYNLVICLFLATGILIIISIIEMYSVFRGKSDFNEEILNYIYYVMHGDSEYQIKKDILQNYTREWNELVGNQNKEEYEQYLKIFNDCINVILSYKTDLSITDVEQVCYKMAYCLLTTDNNNTRARGICFIQEIYEQMWIFVSKANVNECQYTRRFNLFGEISTELVLAMRNMPILIVEQSLRWEHLSDSITRVAYCFISNNNADDNESISEVLSCYQFSRYIGSYLNINKGDSIRIQMDYWGSFLKRMYLSDAYGLPEKLKNKFLLSKCITYFNYCCGLINNGFIELIRESVYLGTIGNIYNRINRYEALFYLLLECYLYYLGEKETTDCISQELQDKIKELLQENSHKNIFYNLLYTLSENEVILKGILESEIYEILSGYELFPKHSNSKSMIMDRTVKEFYVFLTLYMENQFYVPDIFKSVLNNDVMSYHNQFLEHNEEVTKRNLKRFYQLFDVDNKEDNIINSEVDLIFNKFNSYIIDKYKTYAISEAKRNQIKYEETINEVELTSKINTIVEKHIKDVFMPIISDKDYGSGMIKIHLLRCDYLTEILEEKSVNGFFSYMDGNLVHGICDILQKRNIVKYKMRTDFTDDNEYIKYLSENQTKILMGSEFALRNVKHQFAEEFKNFAKGCKCIYTGYTKKGLALKSGSVMLFVNSINVSIHPPSLAEIQTEYDDEEEKYRYEIRGGVSAYFTKYELKDFVQNQRKILDISAWVNIKTDGDNVGSIIQRQ